MRRQRGFSGRATDRRTCPFQAQYADYLSRFDTVTLAAGDANRHNLLLQRVDNLNPATKKMRIVALRPSWQSPGRSKNDGRVAARSGLCWRDRRQPGCARAGADWRSRPERLDGDGDGIACE